MLLNRGDALELQQKEVSDEKLLYNTDFESCLDSNGQPVPCGNEVPVAFPMAGDFDFMCFNNGNSLAPIIMPGDFIALKKSIRCSARYQSLRTMTRASPSPRWSMASPLIPKFQKISSSRSIRSSATTAASDLDLQKRHIPRLSSKEPNRGMPIYIPTVPNGLPVKISTIPCVSPQEPSFFLRHPSYIFSSSSPTQQDIRIPYPRKPPNPKSMR